MKKTLLTVSLVGASLAAFAQGKVNVLNDSLSLVVLTTDATKYKAADASQGGQPIGNSAALLSGIVLDAGLYGGTSSTALFLYSFTTMNVAANPGGTIPAFHTVLNANATTGAQAIPGIPGGTAIGPNTPYFMVKIWDNSFANYDAAVAAQAYVGAGPLFQLNPQTSSIAYQNTVPPGVNSTWQDVPIVVALAVVPEPATFALAGLGAAAMLIFRRRK